MFDHMTETTLLVHAGATWFMVGLIWFVQIVHYPLMGTVPAESFAGFEEVHRRRTTWVVCPVMLVEGACAVLLLWLPREASGTAKWLWVGLGLLATIWASTFAIQVPLHRRLASGFERETWRRLVTTNWLRTLAWTARGVIALGLLR